MRTSNFWSKGPTWKITSFLNSGDTSEFDFLENFHQKSIFSWIFFSLFLKWMIENFENFDIFDHFLNFFMIMKIFDKKIYQINPWKYYFYKEIIDFDYFLKNFRLRRWKIEKSRLFRIYLKRAPPNRSVSHRRLSL